MHPPDAPEELDSRATVAALQAEIARLRVELAMYKSGVGAAKSTVSWVTRAWFGSDVRVAAQHLSSAAETWRRSGTGAPPISESINFFGALGARLTRIGMFRVAMALLIAAGTLWFSVVQVMLLDKQNELIDAQKRAQALELYFRLSDQYADVMRAYSQAGELSSMHNGALLYAKDSQRAMIESLEKNSPKLGTLVSLQAASPLLAGSARVQSPLAAL
jgi:hypothetical protein